MRKAPWLCVAIFSAALTASAQFLDLASSLPTTAPGADFVNFARLFGKSAAFTAHSEVRVIDQNQKETSRSVMELTMRDNKMRLEIDVTTAKHKDLPPGAAASLKPLGLDQIQVIMRPDRQAVYFIFPKAGMYINLPMEKAELEAAAKSQIKSTPLGKETVDGHPCVKNSVSIVSPNGDRQDLTVWNATDLKNLPVQTIEKQGDDTITTHYTKFQFVRPDPKQFEPPAGAEDYKGMAAFMQGMLKRALGGSLTTDQ